MAQTDKDGDTSSSVPHLSSPTKRRKEIAGITHPGPYHVICARGYEVRKHQGNILFKQKIQEMAREYDEAKSKLFKSLHVTSIISFFEQNGGGFVTNHDSIWYKVSEQLAREKVGQALRDQLSSQYKSSTKSKRQRWKQEAAESTSLAKTYDEFVRTNATVQARMESLGSEAGQATASSTGTNDGPKISDEALLDVFTANNKEMLKTIVSDKQIQKFLEDNGRAIRKRSSSSC